jgi:hypothetical protein
MATIQQIDANLPQHPLSWRWCAWRMGAMENGVAARVSGKRPVCHRFSSSPVFVTGFPSPVFRPEARRIRREKDATLTRRARAEG